MSTLHQALELQGLLEQVGEQIKDNPRGRSYLSRDGRAYVLALGGDQGREMQLFMTAVGRYLMKTREEGGEAGEAKAELMKAFDDWLSKQRLS